MNNIPARKITKPNHHNCGRVPNFNQNFSRRINFVSFSCKGLAGNMLAAYRNLSISMQEKEWSMLPESDKDSIRGLIQRMHDLRTFAEEVGQLAADINASKTILDLGQKKTRKERAYGVEL